MNYIEVSIKVKEQVFTEILEAVLAQLEFESFQTEGLLLKAYIQAQAFDEATLRNMVLDFDSEIELLEINEIAHQNWNEVWESNYPPVQLDSELFIGATFHDIPKDVNHSIILDPNMSFGTGHHATTEMMLRAMFGLDMTNWNVMDFGCGSAILAIYAAYKNARGVGIEIDSHAAEAARKNLELNHVSSFTIETGGIEKMKHDGFDLILANINKNIIEECIETFKKSAKKGTQLFCSGFLTTDVEDLKSTLETNGFKVTSTHQIEDWAMIASKYTL